MWHVFSDATPRLRTKTTVPLTWVTTLSNTTIPTVSCLEWVLPSSWKLTLLLPASYWKKITSNCVLKRQIDTSTWFQSEGSWREGRVLLEEHPEACSGLRSGARLCKKNYGRFAAFRLLVGLGYLRVGELHFCLLCNLRMALDLASSLSRKLAYVPGPTFGFVKLLASSGSHCTKWADEQHRPTGFESQFVPDLPLPCIPTLIGLRAFDLVSSPVWWEAATNKRKALDVLWSNVDVMKNNKKILGIVHRYTNPRHKDERTCQSSSCHATSTDLADTLSPLISIVHRSREVFLVTSYIGIELLYIGTCWSSNFCSSVWKGPREYISYEFVLTFPAIWIVFMMGCRRPCSSCLEECCLQDLFNIVRSILV